MYENKYSAVKILFIIIIFIYGVFGIIDSQNFLLIKSVDLMFHEFGHLFFMFGGEMLHFFGGTIMQLLIPNVFLFYFFGKRKFYSCAVMLFWIAVNLFDVAIYIKDARAMDLPLLISGSTHDWNHILTVMGLIDFDLIIGNIVFGIGIIYFLLSIILGI